MTTFARLHLSERVRVARRFRRSVRVDADLNVSGLDGFVCSDSAVEALLSMGRQFEGGQGAFTWTGPYGCGKSSLALALAALLGSDTATRTAAHAVLGDDVGGRIAASLSGGDAHFPEDAWRVAAVVGRRADPAAVIIPALEAALAGTRSPTRGRPPGRRDAPPASPRQQALALEPASLLSTLVDEIQRRQVRVLLIVDEMGKFLEEAASGSADVYFFQQLAEAASRSSGCLLVVGILHQAFDDYAHRLAREARDEWLKVQGRFSDIPVNVAGEEQIEIISRAVEASDRPSGNLAVAQGIAAAVRRQRIGISLPRFAERLHQCWPLHPAVACLLGPVSRRRFGQNQRSIFGFLNSAEPGGFQEFLAATPAESDETFDLPRLWQYLQANLEPSILASPDGHRWSLAVEAVERCEARGGDTDHVDVVRAVALIDLLRERSGLVASREVIGLCLPHLPPGRLDVILADLRAWSVIIHKRHLDGFSVFAGSDFDIEAAVREAYAKATSVDLGRVRELAALQPLLAKRHYHETGALRWFDLDMVSAPDAIDAVRRYAPRQGATGLFLLIVGTRGETPEQLRRLARAAADAQGDWPVVIGWSRDGFMIRELAAELMALETIRLERPELRGDAVARREVAARTALVATEAQDRVRQAVQDANWIRISPRSTPRTVSTEEGAALGQGAVAGVPVSLSGLASAIADDLFPQGPRVPNELLNRQRTSSNAMAAMRSLLYAMVTRPEASRLGIEGYPAEGGLYASLLERTGLHGESGFSEPAEGHPSRLAPLWSRADELFSAAGAEGASLNTLWMAWREPPYGVRDGLMPVLSMAYVLTRADRLAVYLDGVFQAGFGTFMADRLLQDPASVRLRWSETSALHRDILTGVAGVVVAQGWDRVSEPPLPIEIARGLVGLVTALSPWTLRTRSLSPCALRVRDLAKLASDPNKFLLDDLPTMFGGVNREPGTVVAAVREGLSELQAAYPAMLDSLRDGVLLELRVALGDGLAGLQERAKTVLGLTGDYRLDAFATRLSTYDGGREATEGLASLAAGKPPRDWADRDVDQARVELAALSQQFVQAEGLAHVKGRNGRLAMAIFIGDPGRTSPITPTFDVPVGAAPHVRYLAGELLSVLGAAGVSRDLALAAIAEAATQIADGHDRNSSFRPVPASLPASPLLATPAGRSTAKGRSR